MAPKLFHLMLLLLVLLLSACRAKRRKGMMPEILNKEKYRNIYASVNETATLPCTVQRTSTNLAEKVLFHWTKDGIVIWRQTRLRKVSNLHLEITKVQKSDTGYYRCYADNNFGRDSAERILHVNGHPMPPRPSSSPTLPLSGKGIEHRTAPPILSSFAPPVLSVSRVIVRKKGYAGRWIKLKCPAKFSARSFTFQWFKDSTAILPGRSSRRVLKARGRKLMVRQFIATDAGNYTCRVTNALGAAVANVTFLVEFYRTQPPISTPPKLEVALKVRRGSNVTLSCLLPRASDAKMRLVWRTPKRQSRERSIQSARRGDRTHWENFRTIKLNGTALIHRYYLRNVSVEDSGDYHCYVGFNKHREQQAKELKVVHLTVEEDLPLQPVSTSKRKTSVIIYLVCVPVSAGVFIIVVISMCVRKHKQEAKKLQAAVLERAALPASNDHDDDDDGSDFVLPAVPRGVLRVHKPPVAHTQHSASISRKSCDNSLHLNDSGRFFISPGHLHHHAQQPQAARLSSGEESESPPNPPPRYHDAMRGTNCVLQSHSSEEEVTDPDDDRPHSSRAPQEPLQTNTWPKYRRGCCCGDGSCGNDCRDKLLRGGGDPLAKLPCARVRPTTMDEDFVRKSECLKHRSWSFNRANFAGGTKRRRQGESPRSKTRSMTVEDFCLSTDESAPLTASNSIASSVDMVRRKDKFSLVDDDGYCSPSSNSNDSGGAGECFAIAPPPLLVGTVT